MFAYCPFCGEQFYEREEGPGDEEMSGVPFGMHAQGCRENPEYKETEIDLLKKELWPDHFKDKE